MSTFSFNAIFEQIDISIVVYEPLEKGSDFRVAYLNPSAKALCSNLAMGMRIGEMFAGMHILESPETVLQTFQRVYESGTPQSFTFPLCTIDVSEQWRNGYAYRLESGHIATRCMPIGPHAQTPFAEHEQRTFRLILDTAPIGIWSQDEKGKMQFVNRAFCEAVGITEQEFLSVGHYRSLYPEAIANACIASDRRCLAQEEPYVTYERLPFVDGKTHELMIIKTRVSDSGGNVKGLIGLSLDMTEKLETKRQLEAMNATLERRITEALELNKQRERMLFQQQKLAAMGEMISNIAHQWRQPLNTLGLLLTDLSFKMLHHPEIARSCDFESFSDRSNEIIQYLSDTIDDFRFFYREDGDANSFCTKEVENSLEHLVKHSLLSSKVTFMTDFEKAELQGYKNNLKQALINLYTNANNAIAQHGVKEGKIWSKGVVEGDWYVIQVEDNGGGIDAEIIDKVFEPYFTTKHKSQGTGLGLYMTRQIIETKFRGRISVKNGVEGACFIIKIPLGNRVCATS